MEFIVEGMFVVALGVYIKKLPFSDSEKICLWLVVVALSLALLYSNTRVAVLVETGLILAYGVLMVEGITAIQLTVLLIPTLIMFVAPHVEKLKFGELDLSFKSALIQDSRKFATEEFGHVDYVLVGYPLEVGDKLSTEKAFLKKRYGDQYDQEVAAVEKILGRLEKSITDIVVKIVHQGKSPFDLRMRHAVDMEKFEDFIYGRSNTWDKFDDILTDDQVRSDVSKNGILHQLFLALDWTLGNKENMRVKLDKSYDRVNEIGKFRIQYFRAVYFGGMSHEDDLSIAVDLFRELIIQTQTRETEIASKNNSDEKPKKEPAYSNVLLQFIGGYVYTSARKNDTEIPKYMLDALEKTAMDRDESTQAQALDTLGLYYFYKGKKEKNKDMISKGIEYITRAKEDIQKTLYAVDKKLSSMKECTSTETMLDTLRKRFLDRNLKVTKNRLDEAKNARETVGY